MRTYKPPDSKFYHYEFIVRGTRIQRSSRLTNREDAKSEMARHRNCMVMGVPFIPSWEQKASIGGPASAPAEAPKTQTLEEFEDTFMQWVRSQRDSERTRQFYAICYRRLCEFRKLGTSPLDMINAPMIEEFKLHALKDCCRTTVNRYLATLRKALRFAMRNLSIINRVPIIELYDNEPGREYVYSDDDYQKWLELAPEPLRSASVLARECGICRGELLALQKDAVHLQDYEDIIGFWGVLEIKRGLKRAARMRDLKITRNMEVVLQRLMAQSQCEYVFTALEDRKQPLSVNTLADQHRRITATGEFNPNAGLHALRHSFLTEAGRYTQNVKALQRLAGHSRIETTMRYVHPEQSDMDAIAGQVQRARQQRAEERAKQQRMEPTTVPTPPMVSPVVN